MTEPKQWNEINTPCPDCGGDVQVQEDSETHWCGACGKTWQGYEEKNDGS